MRQREQDEERETKRVKSYDELHPGRFMKASLFQGKEFTFRIADVFMEKMEGESGGKKWKGIITMKQTELQLILNRTNGECLKAMFGTDLAQWTGKRVTLFTKMVPSFGDDELAIRVRGSPDIPNDITATITLPRKKPFTMLLKRTGGPVKASQVAQVSATAPIAQASEPGREPGADEDEDAQLAGFGAEQAATL